MADQTAHELAELVSHVFPPLPCDAAAGSFRGSNRGSQLVTLKRRDGDRYLAAWSFVAPPPGEKIELYVVRDLNEGRTARAPLPLAAGRLVAAAAAETNQRG
jgi:hypothetical protein